MFEMCTFYLYQRTITDYNHQHVFYKLRLYDLNLVEVLARTTNRFLHFSLELGRNSLCSQYSRVLRSFED